jgi:hypothetical protein
MCFLNVITIISLRRIYLHHVIFLFSTRCKTLSFIHRSCSLKSMLIIYTYNMTKVYFIYFYFLVQLLRIHCLARILTDRPSPGSTTMDDVLNSLLGLQQGAATVNNFARYHYHNHRSSGGGGDSGSGGDLRRRPYAASAGTAGNA